MKAGDDVMGIEHHLIVHQSEAYKAGYVLGVVLKKAGLPKTTLEAAKKWRDSSPENQKLCSDELAKLESGI